jgi:hypothetical protein
LRIPGASGIKSRGDNSILIYEKAIWSVFSSLAALELEGNIFESISLPLLGGLRNYPIEQIMAILLKLSNEWLQMSRNGYI